MAPLVVLVVVTAVAWLLGALGVGDLDHPRPALAIGLAAMFLLTATAHFVQPRRKGLIAIVPPSIPRPALVVTVTGVVEVVLAALLLFERTRTAAAIAAAVLLVAVFPANVRAARTRLHPAAPHTPLALRTAIQLVFLGACLVVALA